jgi:hypothetical protein
MRFSTAIVPAFPDEKAHREDAAHAEVMTADGYPERS